MLLPLSLFLSASFLPISSIFLCIHENGQMVILRDSLSWFPYEFLCGRRHSANLELFQSFSSAGRSMSVCSVVQVSQHMWQWFTEDQYHKWLNIITMYSYCNAITSHRRFWKTFHIFSFSTSIAPLPLFHFSLKPAPPLLSFIANHLHNEARA